MTAVALSRSRPAPVLRIEIRRSVVLWAVPLLLALFYFDSFRTAAGFPPVWTVRSSVITSHMVADFGPFAAGLAAWVASREGRRKIDDLLATTVRPAWARQASALGATLFWLLLTFLAGVAAIYIDTARQATWGGPPLWPVAVGVVEVVTFAVIGFTAGALFPGRFTAPLAAIGTFLLAEIGFHAALQVDARGQHLRAAVDGHRGAARRRRRLLPRRAGPRDHAGHVHGRDHGRAARPADAGSGLPRRLPRAPGRRQPHRALAVRGGGRPAGGGRGRGGDRVRAGRHRAAGRVRLGHPRAARRRRATSRSRTPRTARAPRSRCACTRRSAGSSAARTRRSSRSPPRSRGCRAPRSAPSRCRRARECEPRRACFSPACAAAYRGRRRCTTTRATTASPRSSAARQDGQRGLGGGLPAGLPDRVRRRAAARRAQARQDAVLPRTRRSRR